MRKPSYMAAFLVLLINVFDGGPVLAGTCWRRGGLPRHKPTTEEYIHYSLLYMNEK